MCGAMSYKSDKDWADGFLREIIEILRQNAPCFQNFSIADSSKNDVIIKTDGGDFAIRVRRDGYIKKFHDWTIRSYRANGQKTELEKLRDGFARWYLYLWTAGDSIIDWILIDLNRARETSLLYKSRHHISNGDGTYFIAITIRELERNGCLVATKNHQFQQLTFF